MQDLTPNQCADVMRRFPQLELSYETVAHKKVLHPYNICLAVPPGKKAFLWFTFMGEDDVCLLMELGREKKVGRISVIGKDMPVKLALNTLFYGTIWVPEESPDQRYFLIEDAFFSEGIPLKKLMLSEKLGFVDSIMTSVQTSCKIPVYLPVMWRKEDQIDDAVIPATHMNKIPYPIHHLQYRSLNTIAPFLNVSLAKKIGSPSNTDKTEELMALMIPPPSPQYDFGKPQYRMPTVFEIKADLQFDIYHLYAFGAKSKREYYGLAYIPNYKTSVLMNGIFRKIKENKSLDYIEESDDEDDFQDMRIDKYVDLKKTAVMECMFHPKFKRWVPARQIPGHPGGKIVHIGKLCR